MNDFFKLLRDFLVFLPLAVLIFGMFLSLTAINKGDQFLLIVGLIIFLYGLTASFLRQFYKDQIGFLRKKNISETEYLASWRKYHLRYYLAQSILLITFAYVLHNWSTISSMDRPILFSAPLFTLTPFGWEAISALVLTITAILIWIQAKATVKLAENETRPIIDVCIIYNISEGTIIHFLNKKEEIPALVWITIEIFIDNKKIKTNLDPRFIGKEPWPVLHVAYKTSTIEELDKFTRREEYKNKKIELSLKTYLSPIFLPDRKYWFNRKHYIFDHEKRNYIDTFWGISDEYAIHPNFRK